MAAPPIVVLEGLDGVGKSSTARALADAIGAIVLSTPPEEFAPFRAFFDARPPLRPGYYMAGNFIAAQKMAALSAAGRPVVCDRFYASTAAYALGKSLELPPEGGPEYEWPPELLRPTFMFQLVLPEAERLERRAGRADVAETREEAELREDSAKAARVSEAFRRVGCVCVSAAGSTKEIVARILHLMSH